ncbi:hypothetical protein NDU88_002890 [Pleurodeles waltl]|uniref:Uncharacterized protein n=1 Tax=Pleurodeles waltl TaxID=8319 RepID=A0AAV7WRH2_PLEWA|nr:hypothetical protein NDU88_002890 [Pleurodeles waltl]
MLTLNVLRMWGLLLRRSGGSSGVCCALLHACSDVIRVKAHRGVLPEAVFVVLGGMWASSFLAVPWATRRQDLQSESSEDSM